MSKPKLESKNFLLLLSVKTMVFT